MRNWVRKRGQRTQSTQASTDTLDGQKSCNGVQSSRSLFDMESKLFHVACCSVNVNTKGFHDSVKELAKESFLVVRSYQS